MGRWGRTCTSLSKKKLSVFICGSLQDPHGQRIHPFYMLSSFRRVPLRPLRFEIREPVRVG